VIYADTNVLLALFCADDLSDAAVAWYGAAAGPVAISHWSVIEFRSSIGVRIRKKILPRSKGLTAIAEFDQLAAGSLHFVVPDVAHFEAASRWLASPDCAMRSGDALHLAIAFGGGCTEFLTFDRPLAAAAKRLHLAVRLLTP
jgi:predicted nucleic acid-binding protein